MVKALRGRDKDKGSLFAVTAADERFIYICDGKERPLERPKRKNIRHLTSTGLTLSEEGMKTNRQLRRSLRALSEQTKDGSSKEE